MSISFKTSIQNQFDLKNLLPTTKALAAEMPKPSRLPQLAVNLPNGIKGFKGLKRPKGLKESARTPQRHLAERFILLPVAAFLLWFPPLTPATISASTNSIVNAAPTKPLAYIPTALPQSLNTPGYELSIEQDQLVQSLTKRYRVSPVLMAESVIAAYKVGQQYAIDPHLILSIIAIESAFNPYAHSKAGAMGLMQVLPSAHPEKLNGQAEALLDPAFNIKTGTKVLHQYVKALGSIDLALKKYVGSAAFLTDNGYGSKVLTEYARIKQTLGIESVALEVPIDSPLNL